MKDSATASVTFVKDRATGRGKFVKFEQTDSFRNRSERRASGRRTVDMTSASRSNKFDVLNFTQRGLEVEENAVDVVQEIVEIIVDSGAANSVCPIRKEGVTRTKVTTTVRLAAARGSPIRVEGDDRLEFVRDGEKCNMKRLDADGKGV